MTGLHKGQNASKNCVTRIVSRYPKFGGTPICPICSLVKSFNEDYYFKIASIFKNVIPCSWQKILFLTRVILKSFQKKKKDSSLCLWSYFFDLVMLCYILSCFSWHILLQGQEFWVLQLIPHVLGTKIEIYYSPVTIHCYHSLSLFTSYCLYIYIIPISCCRISYHYVFYRFTKLHVTMHFELYIYLDCWIFPIYTNIVLTALK